MPAAAPPVHRRLAPILTLAAGLAGCAATPYQPLDNGDGDGDSGGWSDTRYADDVYVVAFHANAHTSARQASDFARLRAAELTLARGYRWFIVLHADRDGALAIQCFAHPAAAGPLAIDAQAERDRLRASYQLP
jgi:hypothetical protein